MYRTGSLALQGLHTSALEAETIRTQEREGMGRQDLKPGKTDMERKPEKRVVDHEKGTNQTKPHLIVCTWGTTWHLFVER